ncbi:hypothetical protein TKK_0000101 [Trichogramma kaykai]
MPRLIAENFGLDSPVLNVALCKCNVKAAEMLLRSGADPNLADAQGWTALHYLCYKDVSLAELLFKISEENHRIVQVDPVNQSGQTPLFQALYCGCWKLAKLFLKKGANPNFVNEYGSTCLHIIFENEFNDNNIEEVFEIIDDLLQTVQVDAQDKCGNTPLHLAACLANKKMLEFLLIRGAHSNLANDKGLTPLHMLCDLCENDNDPVILLILFFEVNKEVNQFVQVDAVDKFGRTPLHYAVKNQNKKMIEFLLRKFANPNMADCIGLTPLHKIVKILGHDDDDDSDDDEDDNDNDSDDGKLKNLYDDNDDDNELVKIFFDTCDEIQQKIHVDARDELGRTPLQMAVTYLLPNVIDELFNHGADLSSFDFPTDDRLNERIESFNDLHYENKLRLANRGLAVIDCLKKRRYQLNPTNTLTIGSHKSSEDRYEPTEDLSVSDVLDVLDD